MDKELELLIQKVKDMTVYVGIDGLAQALEDVYNTLEIEELTDASFADCSISLQNCVYDALKFIRENPSQKSKETFIQHLSSAVIWLHIATYNKHGEYFDLKNGKDFCDGLAEGIYNKLHQDKLIDF